MTQAPTPGPLSAEGVKLLRKGDLLLALETTCNFFAGEVLTFEGPGPLSECMVNGMSWMASRFAFIGRPGADGWMPWSGGENPVPGRVVEIELRGLGLIGPDLSDHFDWRHEADNEDQDVIAFRLAPIAPVEASGSEREADAWKWLGQLYPNDAPSDLAYDANEMVDAFLAGSGRSDRMAKALERIAGEQQYRSGYCQTDITVEPALSADEAQTVAREALAHNPALRPQPSGETREHGPKCWGKTSISDEMMYCYCGSTDSPPGETREALDRLKMAAHVYEDDEMAADCATLEALLSARPLALGGQS